MDIKKFQNYSTQFKAGYPVINWVRESNGSYAPAVSRELNEKLQRTIINLLNSNEQGVKPEKSALAKQVKRVISAADSDFKTTPVSRSFYNKNGGLHEDVFEPIGYIVTGHHAEHMNNNLGKPLGIAKSVSTQSAEANIARRSYFAQGLNFVKKLASKFKQNDVVYGLHTKFEVVRSKTGKIKGYKLLDLKFCPVEGAESPLVKLGYTKK